MGLSEKVLVIEISEVSLHSSEVEVGSFQNSHDNASSGALNRMFKNVTSFTLAQMNGGEC